MNLRCAECGSESGVDPSGTVCAACRNPWNPANAEEVANERAIGGSDDNGSGGEPNADESNGSAGAGGNHGDGFPATELGGDGVDSGGDVSGSEGIPSDSVNA